MKFPGKKLQELSQDDEAFWIRGKTSSGHSEVGRNLPSFSMLHFSRSGMQSIQEKTCLSQTKAWSGTWTVPPLTRLPSQSLSSTHRLDLTASTNPQLANSTYIPHHSGFPCWKTHVSRYFSRSPAIMFSTAGH